MRLSIIALIAAGLSSVIVSACGDYDGESSGGASGSDGKITVVTTLPLFADFAREVGGDRVEVTPLVPAGADPHTWEPSPGDIRTITDADLAFANGLDLEPGAIGVIEPNLSGSAPLVVLGEEAEKAGAALGALPEGFEQEAGESPEEGEDHGDDPHLWMDPANVLLYAGIIRDAFITNDPDGESSYDENYARYASEIEEVSQYVTDKVGQVPAENRKLVTTHDAFGYFARAYGLRIVAFVAPEPGREASPEDVATLTQAMQDEGVPAVFVEPQVEGQGEILEQAAQDAGVQNCTLYSDSLDDTVTTYIELMRFNADELARCLGGE